MVYLEKSQPAPESLAIEKKKASGKYNKEDVLKRLVSDFKNKCYICEYKQPSIEVEHFVPHKGNVDLKFDWNNLFFACGHCNGTKLAKPEYDNILNCTVKEDDVENRLKYIFYLSTHKMIEEVIIESLDNSDKTNNTKNLLQATYNGSTPTKKFEANNLKSRLRDEIKNFNDAIKNYQTTNNKEEKDYFLEKIKSHIDKSSDFTAFKRWIIKDSPKLKMEFEQYFD